MDAYKSNAKNDKGEVESLAHIESKVKMSLEIKGGDLGFSTYINTSEKLRLRMKDILPILNIIKFHNEKSMNTLVNVRFFLRSSLCIWRSLIDPWGEGEVRR
jgi:hypothetical protein